MLLLLLAGFLLIEFKQLKPINPDNQALTLANLYFYLRKNKMLIKNEEKKPMLPRSFIKGWAPGKLTGCEDGFARLLPASQKL